MWSSPDALRRGGTPWCRAPPPQKLMPISHSRSSYCMASTVAPSATPALLTIMLTASHSATTLAAHFSIVCAPVPPIIFDRRVEGETPSMSETRLGRRGASSSAPPPPMPEAAPVTAATRPLSSIYAARQDVQRYNLSVTSCRAVLPATITRRLSSDDEYPPDHAQLVRRFGKDAPHRVRLRPVAEAFRGWRHRHEPRDGDPVRDVSEGGAVLHRLGAELPPGDRGRGTPRAGGRFHRTGGHARPGARPPQRGAA